MNAQMKAKTVCRMKPYIQPFERTLALAEISALAQAEPVASQNADKAEVPILFSLASSVRPEKLIDNLAYWESIETDSVHPTTQVLRERTVYAVRNGIAPDEIPSFLHAGEIGLPNRRCLRYGTHGIHEYRGKFFPQLVRSLINIAGAPEAGLIADPMCGSGTTCVESVLGGRRTIGLDMNPLSVFMSRVKCSLLCAAPDALASAYESLRAQLLRPKSPRTARLAYFESLPDHDQGYLVSWFSAQALQELDEISCAILQTEVQARDFFRLCLSNILRRVSWQKVDDLRVRKEARQDTEIDPIREFLEEAGRSVRTVLALLYQNSGCALGKFEIAEEDARSLAAIWKRHRGKVDAVITSPPYATALPYLDTDRLSLCYLGLFPRSSHRKRDQDMVGNREIGERQRAEYWSLFERSRDVFPMSVSAVIEKVHSLNSKADVGFRRRNLPALLTKYFLDMRCILQGIKEVLRPNRPAYIVIGNNHTIAGGERVDIDTATLLTDVASAIGLGTERRIPMDMLVSRGIFRNNAVASEEILCFRNPS
jgi:site-specific DNA-methyltransferase (cytosine-N4-specific)